MGQPETCAALEIAGSFVTLKAERDLRLALTGAPMRATCGGAPLVWHAFHAIKAGATIEVTALIGGFGYLSFGGGLEAPKILGRRSTHLTASIGRPLAGGDHIALGRRH